MRENHSKHMLKFICILLVIVLLTVEISLPCFADEKKTNYYSYKGPVKESEIIVSLGDSYSSGEGMPPFYYSWEEWNKNRNCTLNEWMDLLAHRSKNSWPGMLTLEGIGQMKDHRDENWFFFAVSGAESKHISKEQQIKEYQDGGLIESLMNGTKTEEMPLQIEILTNKGYQGPSKNTVDYVTITIGGNDAGFGDIITQCVLTPSYLCPNLLPNKLDTTWKGIDEIIENIKDAYVDIANAAGPQAHIIVAGYPTLFSEDLVNGKPWIDEISGFIEYPEAVVVNEAVRKFNNRLAETVDECRKSGMNISFVSVKDKFRGHEAYAFYEPAFINQVELILQKEDLKNIGIGSAYSVHPNAAGARAYADCVQERINEVEAEKKILLAEQEGRKDTKSSPEATEATTADETALEINTSVQTSDVFQGTEEVIPESGYVKLFFGNTYILSNKTDESITIKVPAHVDVFDHTNGNVNTRADWIIEGADGGLALYHDDYICFVSDKYYSIQSGSKMIIKPLSPYYSEAEFMVIQTNGVEVQRTNRDPFVRFFLYKGKNYRFTKIGVERGIFISADCNTGKYSGANIKGDVIIIYPDDSWQESCRNDYITFLNDAFYSFEGNANIYISPRSDYTNLDYVTAFVPNYPNWVNGLSCEEENSPPYMYYTLESGKTYTINNSSNSSRSIWFDWTDNRVTIHYTNDNGEYVEDSHLTLYGSRTYSFSEKTIYTVETDTSWTFFVPRHSGLKMEGTNLRWDD